MTAYIQFIGTAITLVIGFIIGAYTFNIPNKWSKWEDVSIVYEGYTYFLLQVRSNNKGDRQFRQIKIIKYANLPPESQQEIFGIIKTLNGRLNLDKK